MAQYILLFIIFLWEHKVCSNVESRNYFDPIPANDLLTQKAVNGDRLKGKKQNLLLKVTRSSQNVAWIFHKTWTKSNKMSVSQFILYCKTSSLQPH